MIANIFSLNAFGVGNPAILLDIITTRQKKSGNQYFIICLQEAKIQSLCNTALNLLYHHNPDFCLTPTKSKSGGLITFWPNNIKKRENDSQQSSLPCSFYSVTQYISVQCLPKSKLTC